MIYAIGDIHGQVTMVKNLLMQVHLKASDDDTILFLGDYIDRGEDSRAVIETLIGLKESRPNTVFLRGNHEQLMLDAAKADPPQLLGQSIAVSPALAFWLGNGGQQTLASYQTFTLLDWWEAISDAHWEFLAATEMEHITPAYHFAHAGLLPPDTPWHEETDPRLWIRGPFLNYHKKKFHGRTVVFGHTPQKAGYPLVDSNKIGLDTAAVYGGPLTCGVLDPEGVRPTTFFQTPYATTTGEQTK